MTTFDWAKVSTHTSQQILSELDAVLSAWKTTNIICVASLFSLAEKARIEAIVPSPMPPKDLKLGIYRLHWKSGGTSLAAVGMESDGSYWFAPTNWLSPHHSSIPSFSRWDDVERLEEVRIT